MGQQCATEREISRCPDAAMRLPSFWQQRTASSKQKPTQRKEHRPQHAPNQAAYWRRDEKDGTVYKKPPAPTTGDEMRLPARLASSPHRETNTASPSRLGDHTSLRVSSVPSTPESASLPSPEQKPNAPPAFRAGSPECSHTSCESDSPYYSPGPNSPYTSKRQATSPIANLDLGSPYISGMEPGVLSVIWPEGVRLRALPQPAPISADPMIAPCGYQASVTQFSIDRSGCEYGYAVELGYWLPTRLCTGESLVTRVSDLPAEHTKKTRYKLK